MLLIAFLLIHLHLACAYSPGNTVLNTGAWLGVIQLKDEKLPFNFTVTDSSGSTAIIIMNGEERIRVNEMTFVNDSLFIRMPDFDSEFRVKYNAGTMQGLFINHTRRDNNVFPFTAAAGVHYRFAGTKPASINLSGRWECDFSEGTADSSKAIGEFEQSGDQLRGTYLTTSGDYRYLQGSVHGDSMALSAFDGSHLFLFKGIVDASGIIHGKYYSGNHWRENWEAKRNDQFELPDPFSTTRLKPGDSTISFSFPDLNGKLVSLIDPQFQNKVVIVQIMGTWCPNCMDETGYYTQLYRQFHAKGLEIVSIAFERFPEFEKAQPNLKRLQQRFNIDYLLLFGGQTGEAANRALPALSGIKAYPTSVFMDRSGKVRAIYTGINGPATGEAYEKWKNDLSTLVQKLLEEN